MPITFTPLGPSPAAIGWGMFFDITTDFIGPFPTGTVWFIKYTADAEGNNIVASQTIPATSATRRIELDVRNGGVSFGNYAIPVGQNVHVITQLIQPGNVVVDSGATAIPWVNSSDDYRALLLQIPAAGTGLTTTQADQLTQIVNNTTSTKEDTSGPISVPISELLQVQSINTLLASEITSGPQPGFVASDIGEFCWGVLVKIASLGPNDVPLTPDGDWFVRDLAVVRIFRDSELFIRAPIHTTSKIVDLHPDKASFLIRAIESELWPDTMTVQVNFADGITGQVFLLILP